MASAWHELVERDHDLQNPTSAEKVRLAGSYLRLGRHTTVHRTRPLSVIT